MILLRVFRPFKQLFHQFSTKSAIVSSKAKPIEIPKISLPEFIWKNISKWSNRTATICFETHRSYTYGQLYQRSLAVTRFLRKSLQFRQETVAIILPNVPEYPIVLLGAIQAGLRVTTCNPNYNSDEIRNQLVVSNSQLVFTSSSCMSTVRQATSLPIVEIVENDAPTNGTINFEEISTGETCDPISEYSLNDTILLPFSSGTTGLPKGVQLSHYNIVSNLSQMSCPEFSLLRETTKQDVIPCFLPFFHIYGLVVVMLQALLYGAKLVTIPKFSSDNFKKLLKNYKSDVMYGIPLVVLMANNNPEIKSEDLLGIRVIMSGAAPLGASDVERFQIKTKNKVRIIQGYGMSETSPVTIMQSDKLDNGVKVGGSGFLMPNTRAKVVPTDAPSTENLGPLQSGELVVKGPQVMLGYYNNPEANEEVFTEDGWLKTGDVVFYDEHDHFYVTDRCKELIKVKGFQVAPAELEAVIRCHPSVDDAAVVGVPHSFLGEAPKAFIVLKQGQSVKPSELELFVAAKLSQHKHLTGGVVLVDAIPKNASGKILRRQLKNL